MAVIADRLGSELEEIVGQMDAAAIEAAPVLGADAAIAGEMSASNRGNLHRFLTIAKHADGALVSEVPPEALDIARTIVRRGIELDAIFQGYRRGQQVALQRWTACASEIVDDGPELVRVIQLSLGLVSGYVDETLRRVIVEAQREREAILGGSLVRRAETVRLILDGAPIDAEVASRRLGYELGRDHTAIVLWAEPPGVPAGTLESAAEMLAQELGARRPLTLSAGASTLWAWIGGSSERANSVGEMREAMADSDPNLRVAVGSTGRGISGFRQSHEHAQAVHGLLAGRSGGERISTFQELEVTALAAQNRQRAVEFVDATLGPLAADTASAARLRETLRVFLEEADHAPRAAARLYTHRNTVLQRVGRATELLGHPPGERRLALALALELSHRLGPRDLEG
jgi:DNA-binding PucR family transcriptional regulator